METCCSVSNNDDTLTLLLSFLLIIVLVVVVVVLVIVVKICFETFVTVGATAWATWLYDLETLISVQ